MKKIVTSRLKLKGKGKPKGKAKVNKIKINKQNQNVKVNIKIGNDGKVAEHKQQNIPNSIVSYPLFQDSQPPINIISNHTPRENPIAPPIQIPAQIPLQIPLHTPLTSRLKRIKKIRKIREKIDIIPSPPGYDSDASLQNFYTNPLSDYDYNKAIFNQPGTKREYHSENENKYLSPIIKTTASPYLRVKVKNPKTGRFVFTDGRAYQKTQDKDLPTN